MLLVSAENKARKIKRAIFLHCVHDNKRRWREENKKQHPKKKSSIRGIRLSFMDSTGKHFHDLLIAMYAVL